MASGALLTTVLYRSSQGSTRYIEQKGYLSKLVVILELEVRTFYVFYVKEGLGHTIFHPDILHIYWLCPNSPTLS